MKYSWSLCSFQESFELYIKTKIFREFDYTFVMVIFTKLKRIFISLETRLRICVDKKWWVNENHKYQTEIRNLKLVDVGGKGTHVNFLGVFPLGVIIQKMCTWINLGDLFIIYKIKWFTDL